MNVLSKRKENLENHLLTDYDLLKEYEDKLRLEDDPKKKASFKSEIAEIKERIQANEIELTEISHRLLRSSEYAPPENEERFLPTSAAMIAYGSNTFLVSRSERQPQTVNDDFDGKFISPPVPEDFVGREELIKDILEASSQARFVSLTGISGIGKSSLLKMLAATLSDRDKTFWYEFIPGLVSIEDLIFKLSRFIVERSEITKQTSNLATGEPSVRAHIERLIDELNEGDYRLYLDAYEAAVNDEDVNGFFLLLKNRLRKGLVFIASETRPPIFTLSDEQGGLVQNFIVEGLTAEEIITYFEKKGIEVTFEIAEQLDDLLGGIPLALSLLAGTIDEAGNEQELLAQAETVKERVVEELFEFVYQKLNAGEKELLTTAALMSLPFAKKNLLAAHRAAFGKNAGGDFIALVRRNLIIDLSADYFYVHKTIDSLALTMTNADLEAARETIAEHFLETLPDDYYANLESLLLFVKAKNYDRAANVASDLIDRRFLVFDLEMAENILKNLADKPIGPETRMWFLGDRGLVAHHLHRYDESEEFYEQMRALAVELEKPRGEALALHRLGALYCQMDDLARGENFYRRSLKLRVDEDDYENQAQIHNNLGLIYSQQGDFSAALAEYETALELRRKADSPEWSYVPLYTNLSALYGKRKDWDKAFEYINRALTIGEDFDSPYDLAKSLYNLGVHELKRGDEQNAREKFLRVLETGENYGIVELEELASTALGRSFGDAGDYAKGIYYFERVAEVYEQYGDKGALARIRFDIGTYYFLNEDKQSALTSYLEGIALLAHLEEKLARGNLTNVCTLAGDFGDGAETRRILESLKYARRRLRQTQPTMKLARICDSLSAIYLDVVGSERGAIAYLRGRIGVIEKLDAKRELAKAWIDLGSTSEDLERYKDALDAEEKALSIIERGNFADLLSIVLYNIGNTYAKIRDYGQSEIFYRRAEVEAVKTNDTKMLSKIYHNLGETYSRDRRPQEAIEVLQIALQIARDLNENLEIIFSLNSLGLSYEDLKKDAKALTCWHEALELSRRHEFGREEANTLISIGNFYLKSGEFDSAKNYFEQSLDVATRIGNMEMEESAMLSLGLAHRRLGTFPEIEKEFLRLAERAGALDHQENLVKFLAIAGAVNLDEGGITESVRMFEKAFIFSYHRIILLIMPFVDSGMKTPVNALELPFLLSQFQNALQLAVENGKREVAQSVHRNLLESLNRHKFWGEENFINDLIKDIGKDLFAATKADC